VSSVSSGATDGPRAWVLNLDAEEELASLSRGRRRYEAPQRLRRIVSRQGQRLAGGLVGPDDVVVDGTPEAALRARGLPGLAWSPTPAALARLAGAGAVAEPVPVAGVLRDVNARAFAVAVRRPFADGAFAKRTARDLEELERLLARPAALGWLVRRPFGAAGRGRRRLHAGRPGPPAGSLGEVERAWAAAGLAVGELVVEPWVEVTREYTRSGWVHANGRVVVAEPCVQETAAGAWTATKRLGRAAPRTDDERLGEVTETTGRALFRAGYFGPFGIDAFRYRDPASGRELLNPLSEINARFTMDWTDGVAADPAEARARLREWSAAPSRGDPREERRAEGVEAGS